jgi:hypothetical protein
MAKTTSRKTSRPTPVPTPEALREETNDGALTAYAEALGTAMGNLRNRVDDWKGQRAHLVNQLSTMVADAQALLTDLGHNATDRMGRLGRRRKRGVAAPNPAGALKPERHASKKGLTEAGRAAISAAQKRRWAQYKNKRVPK